MAPHRRKLPRSAEPSDPSERETPAPSDAGPPDALPLDAPPPDALPPDVPVPASAPAKYSTEDF